MANEAYGYVILHRYSIIEDQVEYIIEEDVCNNTYYYMGLIRHRHNGPAVVGENECKYYWHGEFIDASNNDEFYKKVKLLSIS